MAPLDDLAARLAAVPLFEGLSEKELAAVRRCASEVAHAQDHVIVREGATGAGFHLLLEGEAVVTQRGRELRRLRPGDYFGEIALLDGGERSATVTAASPLRTLSITAWEFKPLLEEHPLLTHQLLLELCRRLRALEARADA